MNSSVRKIIADIQKSKQHYASSESAVIEFISSFIQMTESTTILEIGTLLGYSTINIAMHLPTNGVIYTVDIDTLCLRFFNRLPRTIKKRIVFVHNNSKIFLRRKTIPRFDIAFIDGDHTFWSSFIDVLGALRHLNHNGHLILHDALHPNCRGVHATIRLIRFVNILTFGSLFDIIVLPTPGRETSAHSRSFTVRSGVAIIHPKYSHPSIRSVVSSIFLLLTMFSIKNAHGLVHKV